MQWILRVLGTWLIAMALILAIIDGTKSLGASATVMTSLQDSWMALNAQTLVDLQGFLDSRTFGHLLNPVLAWILQLPGFIALGVPGLVLLILGRSRRSRAYIRQDQF